MQPLRMCIEVHDSNVHIDASLVFALQMIVEPVVLT